MFDTGGALELEVAMCNLRALIYGVIQLRPMTAAGVARVIGVSLESVNVTLVSMNAPAWWLAEDDSDSDTDTGVLSVVTNDVDEDGVRLWPVTVGTTLTRDAIDICASLLTAADLQMSFIDTDGNLAK